MNRKNRNARFASSASTELNTYLYFKNMVKNKNKPIVEEAMVMRVTKAGLYVMIKSFGVEGLISDEERFQRVEVDTETDTVLVNGSIQVRTFDTVQIEIIPESIEFRRQIKFKFI